MRKQFYFTAYYVQFNRTPLKSGVLPIDAHKEKGILHRSFQLIVIRLIIPIFDFNAICMEFLNDRCNYCQVFSTAVVGFTFFSFLYRTHTDNSIFC